MTADAPHHVELAGGWSLWKWVLVRGAGFPARQVLALAAPAAAAAADELAAGERELAERRRRLIGELEARLDGSGSDLHVAIRDALRKLRRGAAAQLAGDPQVAALAADDAAHAQRLARYAALFAEAGEHGLTALADVAREPRFREAVTWQNRIAVHTGLDRLIARPAGHANKSDRKHAHLVARYLQRYCVKNDSIGFFGPIGWGTLAPGAPTEIRPGRGLLAKRTVYFEHWAIDALAQQLARDRRLAPDLRPRRMPTIRIDGTTLTYRARQSPEPVTAELPLEYARVLAACDGRATAREIARGLVGQAGLELADDAAVHGLLDELVQRGLCTWTLEIPTVTEWPERHLRDQLELAEPAARAPALAALGELEAARGAVARAAGDPAALDAALAALDRTFQRLTSIAATRKGGETYAGRTLVYEDCRRDLAIELGAPLLERLAPPLQLVLTSARWLTFRIAQAYRRALGHAFDQLGGGPVDYATYWRRVEDAFPGDRPSQLVRAIGDELQRTWSELLALDPAARRLEVSARQIAPAVAAAFAAPHPGWPAARYHSPDLMIAAASAAAVRAGDYTCILGELHPSVCTLHFPAQKEHDDRDALIRARELDLTEVIPTQVINKDHASRSDHMWVSRHDVDIELGATRSWRPRDHVIAIAALVVERRDGQLVVRDRDGAHVFDVIELFGSHLSAQVATGLSLLPDMDHRPRVSIDGLVVAREQWRLVPAQLAFLDDKDPAAQFRAARRWAQACDMPRWIFIKVPEEPKPLFVDFDSPIYVDMFCRLARHASAITVTEMLPTLDQTWLPDGEGRTYTSELRIVAVDPSRWQRPRP